MARRWWTCIWSVVGQYTSLAVAFVGLLSVYQADASAGRAFPIDSENYVTEKFTRINHRLVSWILYLLLRLVLLTKIIDFFRHTYHTNFFLTLWTLQQTTAFIDTARIVCGRVYVTVRCPSVSLSRLSTAALCCGGLLLWARQQTISIDRQRRPPGAAAARHSSANASSVTLSADVGSSTRTCVCN